MGWWKSGNGKDIIGDGPVDRILGVMGRIAEIRLTSGQSKPTLEEVLSTAGAAIGDRPGSLLSDPQNVPESPIVKLLMRDGTSINAFTQTPGLGSEAEVLFWKVFDEVAADYLATELERRPTLSELLTCVAFVLRIEGTRYMEGVPEELDIDRIMLCAPETP